MFWLIIMPIIAVFIIYFISKFIDDHPSKQKENNEKGGNLYKQTIFRDDD